MIGLSETFRNIVGTFKKKYYGDKHADDYTLTDTCLTCRRMIPHHVRCGSEECKLYRIFQLPCKVYKMNE